MIKRYKHRYETIFLRGFSLKPLNQGFLGKPSLQRTKINLMKAFNFFCLQYTCRRREQQEIFLFTPGNWSLECLSASDQTFCMLLLFFEQLCLNYGYVYSLASLFCGYQPLNVQLVYWCYNISIFDQFYSVYSYWLARCLAISQWLQLQVLSWSWDVSIKK